MGVLVEGQRRIGWAVACFCALSLAAVSGCSGSDEQVMPPGSTQPSTMISVVSGPQRSTVTGSSTTQPPVTFPADASADAVFLGLADVLPLSDAERACASQKLASDAALLGRVASGVAPGSEDFGVLAGFAASCRRTETDARATANAIAEAHGGTLTREQVDCLAAGYARLAPTDIDLLTEAAMNPKGGNGAKGGELFARLLSDCGVAE